MFLSLERRNDDRITSRCENRQPQVCTIQRQLYPGGRRLRLPVHNCTSRIHRRYLSAQRWSRRLAPEVVRRSALTQTLGFHQTRRRIYSMERSYRSAPPEPLELSLLSQQFVPFLRDLFADGTVGSSCMTGSCSSHRRSCW